MQRESCRNTVGHRHPGSPLAQAEEAFAGVTPYLSGIAHPQEGAPPCNPLLCWKRRAGGSQQPSPPPQKPATPTAQGAYSSHRPEPRSLCPPPLEKKQALPWNPFFKEAAAACASLPNAGARPNTAVSCSPDTNVCRYSHTWTPNRSSCPCMCDAGQTQTQEKFPHQDFLLQDLRRLQHHKHPQPGPLISPGFTGGAIFTDRTPRDYKDCITAEPPQNHCSPPMNALTFTHKWRSSPTKASP